MPVRQSTRQRKKPKEIYTPIAAKGEEEASDVSDVSSVGSDSEEEDFAFPTKSTTPRSTAKKAAKRRSKAPPLSNVELHEAISRRGVSVKSLVESWVSRLEDDPDASMKEILNFVLRVGGYSADITEELKEDYQDVAIQELVEEILERMKTTFSSQSTYSLMGKSKAEKAASRVFLKFWRMLAPVAHSHGVCIAEEDSWVQVLIDWLITISAGNLRSLRHTATAAALNLGSGILDVMKLENQRCEAAQKQLAATPNKKTKKGKDLAAAVEEHENNITIVREWVDSLRDGVFAHRFRDTIDTIRASALESFGEWLQAYPEEYVDNKYLKYFGWQLSDKSSLVRKTAVHSLEGIIEKITDSSKLEYFTSWFRKRLTAMPLDVDSTVAQGCIRLLSSLLQRHMLEDEDVEAVERVMFANDADVRQEAARFLLGDLPAFADIDEELHETAVATAGVPSGDIGKKPTRKGGRRKSGESKHSEENTGIEDPAARSLLHQQFLTILDLCRRHMSAEDAEDRVTDVVEYAVDAMWGQPRAEVLYHWPALTSLLLEDNPVISEGAEFDDLFQLLGIHMLAACARRGCGVRVLKESKRARLAESLGHSTVPSSSDLRAGLTVELVKSLPKLLLRYQTDTDKLQHLVTLCQHLDMLVIPEHNLEEEFKGLLQQITELYQKQTRESMLGPIAAALGKFLQQEKEGQSLTREAVEGLAGSLIERLDAGLEEERKRPELSPAEEETSRSSKRRRVSRKQQGDDDTDPEFDLRVALTRLRLLMKHMNLLDLVPSLDSPSSLLKVQLFDCLEARTSPKLTHTDAAVVVEGLKIAWLDFLWGSKQLFAAAKTVKPDELDSVRDQARSILPNRDQLISLGLSFLKMSPFFQSEDAAVSSTSRVPFSYAVVVRHAGYTLLSDLTWLCSTRLRGTILGSLAWNPSPETVMAMKGFAVEYSENEGVADALAGSSELEDCGTEAVVKALLLPIARAATYGGSLESQGHTSLAATVAARVTNSSKEVAGVAKSMCKAFKHRNPEELMIVQLHALQESFDVVMDFQDQAAQLTENTSDNIPASVHSRLTTLQQQLDTALDQLHTLSKRLASLVGVGKAAGNLRLQIIRMLQRGIQHAFEAAPRKLVFLDVLHVYLRFLRPSDMGLLRAAVAKLEEGLDSALLDELRDAEVKFNEGDEEDEEENEWEPLLHFKRVLAGEETVKTPHRSPREQKRTSGTPKRVKRRLPMDDEKSEASGSDVSDLEDNTPTTVKSSRRRSTMESKASAFDNAMLNEVSLEREPSMLGGPGSLPQEPTPSTSPAAGKASSRRSGGSRGSKGKGKGTPRRRR